MQTEGAFIVRLIEKPTREISIVDVIVGALSIATLMTIAGVALGALLGWILILRSRRRGVQQAEQPPSIHPLAAASTLSKTSGS
ncbi:MAG: hypothetical protein M3R55_16470 [Acidobacteriota bacterium]|nr:hypothetical protein [Acidobacteriota bacterium]